MTRRDSKLQSNKFKTPPSFDFGKTGFEEPPNFAFGTPTPNPAQNYTTIDSEDDDELISTEEIKIESERQARADKSKDSAFPKPFPEKVVDLTEDELPPNIPPQSSTGSTKPDFSEGSWPEFWSTNPLFPLRSYTAANVRTRATSSPRKPRAAGPAMRKVAAKPTQPNTSSNAKRNPILEEIPDDSDDDESSYDSPESDPDDDTRWFSREKTMPARQRPILTPSPRKGATKVAHNPPVFTALKSTPKSNASFKMDDLQHTMPNGTTSKFPASQDSNDADINMDPMESPQPTAASSKSRSEPTTPVDIYGDDMASNVPFDRGAPLTSSFQSVSNNPQPVAIDYHNSTAIFDIKPPVPPIVPSISPSDLELAHYWQEVLRYQNQWNDYQLKIALYFSERQQADQANSLQLLSNSGNLNEYIAVLQQDERVRMAWDVALKTHKQVMVNLLGVRRLKEGW